MEKVVFETVVYAPKDEIYDFLVEFENYGRYSSHIDDVTVVNEDPTEWEITVKWWRLSYTARSRITEREENESISWKLVKDVRAHGKWTVEDIDASEVDRVPQHVDADDATRVSLEVWYQPEDASKANPSRFIPISKLISLLQPVVVREGERVLERVVEDLEGQSRVPELEISQEKIEESEVDGKGDTEVEGSDQDVEMDESEAVTIEVTEPDPETQNDPD